MTAFQPPKFLKIIVSKLLGFKKSKSIAEGFLYCVKHACETLRYSNETHTNCTSCQNLANRNEGLTKHETTSQTLKCIIRWNDSFFPNMREKHERLFRRGKTLSYKTFWTFQEPGVAEDYLLQKACSKPNRQKFDCQHFDHSWAQGSYGPWKSLILENPGKFLKPWKPLEFFY